MMKTSSAAAVMSLLVGCSSPSDPSPQVDGMVHIPAGEFWRGCDPVAVEKWSGGAGECEDDPDGDIALDVPMRSILLSEYWIDKYEATLGEYLACYDAGVCPGIGTVVPENIPEERSRPPADQRAELVRSRDLLQVARQAIADRSRVGEGRARHGSASVAVGR